MKNRVVGVLCGLPRKRRSHQDACSHASHSCMSQMVTPPLNPPSRRATVVDRTPRPHWRRAPNSAHHPSRLTLSAPSSTGAPHLFLQQPARLYDSSPPLGSISPNEKQPWSRSTPERFVGPGGIHYQWGVPNELLQQSAVPPWSDDNSSSPHSPPTEKQPWSRSTPERFVGSGGIHYKWGVVPQPLPEDRTQHRRQSHVYLDDNHAGLPHRINRFASFEAVQQEVLREALAARNLNGADDSLSNLGHVAIAPAADYNGTASSTDGAPPHPPVTLGIRSCLRCLLTYWSGACWPSAPADGKPASQLVSQTDLQTSRPSTSSSPGPPMPFRHDRTRTFSRSQLVDTSRVKEGLRGGLKTGTYRSDREGHPYFAPPML